MSNTSDVVWLIGKHEIQGSGKRLIVPKILLLGWAYRYQWCGLRKKGKLLSSAYLMHLFHPLSDTQNLLARLDRWSLFDFHFCLMHWRDTADWFTFWQTNIACFLLSIRLLSFVDFSSCCTFWCQSRKIWYKQLTRLRMQQSQRALVTAANMQADACHQALRSVEQEDLNVQLQALLQPTPGEDKAFVEERHHAPRTSWARPILHPWRRAHQVMQDIVGGNWQL